MLYFLKEKKDCTGCSACLNICPIHCIKMVQDEEGFNYPIATNECINCKKCELVCPIKSNFTELKPEIDQISLAAISNNHDVWEKSSSGGAFTEICNAFGDDKTIVFGAKFKNFDVVHSYVQGVNHIDPFRKSKYVQSNIGTSFNDAKKFLENGEKVIFSGTPCQIAGLKSFLKRDYKNLLTIDLICHGVGSPAVFKKATAYISKKYKSPIQEYSFREKKIFRKSIRLHISKYNFYNKKNILVERDEYNRLFLNQLCLRPSCGENCKFRTINRMGDITIADFKNLKKVFPQVKDNRNYSTIIINTLKGEKIYDKLNERMNTLPCDIEYVKKYNPLLYKTTQGNPLRDSFFQDFVNGIDFEYLIRKYIPEKFDLKSFIIKKILRID